LYNLAYFLALWQYLIELRPITDEARQSFGFLNTRLAEAVDGIETVKGMVQEESENQNDLLQCPPVQERFRPPREMLKPRFLPLLLLALQWQAACCMPCCYTTGVSINVGEVIAILVS